MDLATKVNIILCILSFILAFISIITVIITLRQNQQMLENSSRPYVCIYFDYIQAGESTALNMFEEAEGAFRKNMIDSINPFYWVDLIIFLPKTLLSYLGISSETSAYKICNVLLTFIWWVFGIFLVYYKPQLQQFLIELVRNI